MSFEFATAGHILFESGGLARVGELASPFGSRALVVGGKESLRLQPLLATLNAAGIAYTSFSVPGEPTISLVEEGVATGREHQVDFVIGMGGGSVIDAAKAISALVTNSGQPLEYLEVIGKGEPLVATPLPFIAIPTTAGTGAEVTKNAVLASPQHRVKVSLRSNAMLPTIALIDPQLTHSMPSALTASTGLDALTQSMEPFVSPLATPLSDGLCREGITRAAASLEQAFRDGTDQAARNDMAIASLCGGLALANAKLGAVHGFAGPLGGMFPVPHGIVCGRLLPIVMAANVAALKQRAPDSPALARYAEVAGLLTGNRDARAEDGILWIEELSTMLAVPGLANFGIVEADFYNAISAAKRASSMKGNPIELTDGEMRSILEQAM